MYINPIIRSICGILLLLGSQCLGSEDGLALRTFFKATNGIYWTNHTNWNSSLPFDLWFGVSVDTQGNVVELDLANNNLAGTIPMSIDALQNLRKLELSNNNIGGQLPISLGEMKSLTSLFIDNNLLTGGLPYTLYTSNISLVSLTNNSLTGSIASKFCGSNSSRIVLAAGNQFDCYEPCQYSGDGTYLDYVGSELYPVCSNQSSILCEIESGLEINKHLIESRAIIELEPVTVKVPIQFSPALLHSPWPSSFSFQHSNSFSYYEPNIRKFEISFSRDVLLGHALIGQTVDCSICSQYSCDMYSITGYRRVIKSEQYLTIRCTRTVVLSSMGNDTKTKQLQFYPFQFTIKRWIQPKLWSCSDIYAGSTNSVVQNPCRWHGIGCASENSIVVAIALPRLMLNGTIPESLAKLVNLHALDLSDNLIGGSIPSWIGTLRNLETMSLSNNFLTGSLPKSLINLTSIVQLDLSRNALSGDIPSWFPDLASSLLSINLAGNHFSGMIPQSICNVSSGNANSLTINLLGNPQLSCFERCAETASTTLVFDPDLSYCAPTQFPTLAPTTPASVAPSTFIYKLVGGIGAIAVIAGITIFWVVRWRQRMKEYAHLPVHKAVVMRKPIDEKMLKRYLSTIRRRDNKGRTALDLVLRRIDDYQISADILFKLFMISFKIDTISGVIQQDNFCWAKLIQHSQSNVCEVVSNILEEYANQVDLLAYSVDEEGRRCIDIASPKCRHLIKMTMYLYRRFELNSGDPEHKSPTSLVRFAVDHKLSPEGVDLSAKVALKFMKDKQQFLSEIAARKSAGFSSEFVLMVQDEFDGDSTDIKCVQFRASAIKKGYGTYPYCLVMDIADTNLQTMVMKQSIAGTDWDLIRLIMKSLAMCLNHIHDKMIMHGDLKPMNVVMVNNGVRLIDFDSCASFSPDNHEYAGYRFSSAYLPPELIYVNKAGVPMVKTFVKDISSGKPILTTHVFDHKTHKLQQLPYSLVKASPAQDLWALGAILYFLCAGVTLFPASVEDNCSKVEMVKLHDWSNELKEEKLAVVTDSLARNLLSLLLEKDPKRRIDASHVLSHPFISGVHPGRLQGEAPQFDVFISYRVDSDSRLVELLYEALLSMGLSVWWDKKSLLPGQPWEEGFCNGLINSCCFVCILSQGAINNPEKPWQNFSELESGSRCDNVLMEWRLALELRERHMIEGIFPVLVGNPSIGDPSNYSDYFASGCHPTKLPDIAVSAMELKLRENLSRQGLGLPLVASRTVRDIVQSIVANQGGFIKGDFITAIGSVAQSIAAMRWQISESSHNGNSTARRGLVHASSVLSTMDQLFGSHAGLSHNGSNNVESDRLKEELLQKTALLQFNSALVTSLEKTVASLEQEVATQSETIAQQAKQLNSLGIVSDRNHGIVKLLESQTPTIPGKSRLEPLMTAKSPQRALPQLELNSIVQGLAPMNEVVELTTSREGHTDNGDDDILMDSPLPDLRAKPVTEFTTPTNSSNRSWLWI